jgi:hypothetical protein
MLEPEALVDHMALYLQKFPRLSSIFVVDEDHFRWPDWLIGIRDPWLRHPELVEHLDWFAFGSLDFIGAFAERYGWDAIAEIGIGVMFVGVESKFGDLLRYKKRSQVDPKWVFSNLHQRGIRTVGSWICGWDFHTHANIMEDLNYFVALSPTYQQLTRLSPFPGTPLWDRVKKEGRLKKVTWEDMHFWSETQNNLALEDHETLNLVEYGYDLLYQTWGPSILRRLDVQLDGYSFSQQSANPVIRRHRSLLFRRQCGMIWTFLSAMQRYAPNGMVRRRAKMIDKKYRAVIGEPSPVMELLSQVVLKMASKEFARKILDPTFYPAREEPFKRYIYGKNGGSENAFSYRVERPTKPPRSVRREMAKESMRYFVLEKAMKARRMSSRRSDPIVDDYLIGLVSARALGFGL